MNKSKMCITKNTQSHLKEVLKLFFDLGLC